MSPNLSAAHTRQKPAATSLRAERAVRRQGHRTDRHAVRADLRRAVTSFR